MVVGSLHTQRIISVVAATVVALASGTNYAYSAWAPQFAERMHLSSKEINLLGVAGNIGLYCSGIPTGILTDTRGPTITLLIGTVSLFLGYYPIYLAYEHGQGYMSLGPLCFFAWLFGLGGSASFSGAIKAAASNFPEQRGTATAFPIAAFGLSAFFFSTMSSIFFHGDTGALLFSLALGTSIMVFVFGFFLRILPPTQSYTSVPDRDTGERQQFTYEEPEEIGRQNINSTSSPSQSSSSSSSSQPLLHARQEPSSSTSGGEAVHDLGHSRVADEATSLVYKPETPTISDEQSGCQIPAYHGNNEDYENGSHYPDIRGLALLRKSEFWQQFLLMGLLSGIGLMTINNIGNTTKALWRYYDDSADSKFIQHRQVIHVSTLSIGSFLGRLLSGVGSDLLVTKLNMSRFWCIFLSSVVFTLTQLAGTSINNPNQLYIISGLTGIAYGFLFGVFPSLVAHTFGITGLSQNWGVMTLAPVLSGNVFNLLYGAIYDHHSIIGPDGQRDCSEGLQCYRTAYTLTFFSGLAGIGVSLYCIWQERLIHGKGKGSKIEDHERMA
ncbi:putative MFS transporter [Talaromyces proteolyticus]|uniref:MFS transporter n=1 Tax=Talaromyces proteolyticus TaxID=1131652 RepID=A0AAD4L3C6_9EURO|nr:putative MFS transporter [Talaromyces proteolyticus]KAH8705172.1 putative MFS transporter [Talaromyces proteolyticus]